MKVHGETVAVWNGHLTRAATRNYSISFCTTCMNRLHDLMQTLPKNISDNASYPHLEFVLLDYNSRDGLENWVTANLMEHIESGRLVYARTTEPQFYQMAHSRNVAFKLATGEIVCNVDADNWTGPGFAEKLNRLANEQPTRAVFTKSRQLIRGRIAFYKHEWEHLLGGYDEDLRHYGFDDMDLMHRALLQGFTLMPFGGQYVSRISTPTEEKGANMEISEWRKTERLNRKISKAKIKNGDLKSNVGRPWGAAVLTKNFSERIVL